MVLEALPEDYLNAVDEFGGREGFLGDSFVRLFRLQELTSLNFAFDVPVLCPEVFIIGSNGCGEAYAFPLNEPAIVQIPFIPLRAECAIHLADSFTGFLQALAASGPSPESNPQTVGMEIHGIHPICLGGSPTDPKNKVHVPVAKYPEICKYWNKIYNDALARQSDSASDSESS
jgi:hypothetical protein